MPDFTVTLVPTVRVLRIQNPEVDTETGRSDSSRIRITLDLLPQDAQNLVFAQENADLARPPAAGRGWDAATGVDRSDRAPARSEARMTDASVVAVGTPQSFRQQVARAVEMGADEVGWVQSATAAEELLINAYQPIDVLVLSPEVKEPDALGLAEFVERQARGRPWCWSGTTPGTDSCRRRCAPASATSST